MEFGWKRIWKLYGLKELFSKKNRLFYFSIVIVVILITVLLLSNHKENLVYILLQKTLDIGLSILPTLLGFNLGAYALIIGFLTNEKLKKAITAQDSELGTGLERISSVFAINIIIQAITLIFSFIIKQFTVLIEGTTLINSLQSFFYSENYVTIVNYVGLSTMFFLTLYSVALVIQNAINIFDFSQLFTYFAAKNEEEL